MLDPFKGATFHPQTRGHVMRTHVDVRTDDAEPQKTKVSTKASSITNHNTDDNNVISRLPSTNNDTGATAASGPPGTAPATSSASSKTSIPPQITNINVNDFPSFVPYDMMDPKLARENVDGCTRLFVGQVPYVLQPGHVAWLMHILSGGRKPVYRVEKIVKWSQKHRACGCFHIYVHPSDVPTFLTANQRALCLMNGVAIAEKELHKQVLLHVCEILKSQGRGDDGVPMPTQLITVQEATSTFRRAPLGANGQVVYRNTAHMSPTPGGPQVVAAAPTPSSAGAPKAHGDVYGGYHHHHHQHQHQHQHHHHPVSPEWYNYGMDLGR